MGRFWPSNIPMLLFTALSFCVIVSASNALAEKISPNFGSAAGSASLRKAQLHIQKKPGFSHPAFWAPFLLIGNWL